MRKILFPLLGISIGVGLFTALNQPKTADAETVKDEKVIGYVYPNGYVFPHPSEKGTVCVLARDHPDPDRPLEAHCASRFVSLGQDI